MELYSGVKSELKKKCLFKGIGFSLSGVTLWIFSSFFLPAQPIYVGALLFLLGSGLISFGLLPYSKLKSIENFPHRLSLHNKTVTFCHKGRLDYPLLLEDIAKVKYIELPRQYGIAVWLHSSAKTSPCYDLFFPYFSKQSFVQLKDWIESFA